MQMEPNFTYIDRTNFGDCPLYNTGTHIHFLKYLREIIVGSSLSPILTWFVDEQDMYEHNTDMRAGTKLMVPK